MLLRKSSSKTFLLLWFLHRRVSTSVVTFDVTFIAVSSPEDFVAGLAGTQHLFRVQIHVVFEHNDIFKHLPTVFTLVSLSAVGLRVYFKETWRQKDSGTVLTAVHLPARVQAQVQPQLQQHCKRLSTFHTSVDFSQ